MLLMYRIFSTVLLATQYIVAKIRNEVIIGAYLSLYFDTQRRNEKYDEILGSRYYASFSVPPSYYEAFDDYGYPEDEVFMYLATPLDLMRTIWNSDDEFQVRSVKLNTATTLGE